METERAINTIQTDKGFVISDPKEMNKTFSSFYENLYRADFSTAFQKQKEFLYLLDFVPQKEDSQAALELDLEAEELSAAIGSIKRGETPGPDGIPIEIYKTFRTKLIPPLFEMYRESLDSGSLPPLNRTVITLLLKPGKTPTLCGSYRPISLLNNDLKILCKVLARRLELSLSEIARMALCREGRASTISVEYLIKCLVNLAVRTLPFCRWMQRRPLTGCSGCIYLRL